MWIKNFRGSVINTRHIISIYKEAYSVNKNDPIKYHVYALVSHSKFENDSDHNFRIETFDDERNAQNFIDNLYIKLNSADSNYINCPYCQDNKKTCQCEI